MGNMFRRIVNEVQRQQVRGIDELPGTRMNFDTSAFIVGDVMVFRGGQGICTGDITRIEGEGNNKIIYFKRTGTNKWGKEFKEGWRSINDPNVYCCLAWLPAIIHMRNGESNRLLSGQKIFYENVDGQLCIVIKNINVDPKTGYKNGVNYYYNHDTGEFIGEKNVSEERQGASMLFGVWGKDIPQAYDVDSAKKQQGVCFPLAEDWIIMNQGGRRFYAWNLDEAEWIGAMCPWLQRMNANWAKPNGKAVNMNPFAQGIAKAISVPADFQHLFKR